MADRWAGLQFLLEGVALRGRDLVVLFLGRARLSTWTGYLKRLARFGAPAAAEDGMQAGQAAWRLRAVDAAPVDRDWAEDWDAAKGLAEGWLAARGMLPEGALMDPARIRWLGRAAPPFLGRRVSVFAVDCGAPGEDLGFHRKHETDEGGT